MMIMKILSKTLMILNQSSGFKLFDLLNVIIFHKDTRNIFSINKLVFTL